MLMISPIQTVTVLDALVQWIAPKIPRVASGGVFWHPEWPVVGLVVAKDAAAVSIQVGKLELILDRT